MKVAAWRGLGSRVLGGKVLRAFIMQVSAAQEKARRRQGAEGWGKGKSPNQAKGAALLPKGWWQV